ncbi:hypothetical protein TIFTF001_007484 [Ficus carica]|uniref:Uncharacterized protein n=1 Tax=Ficus carica TaxID=3494 RepID=A0AA87ZQF8_FICCA|nr:hypothetical protein TIFTF001_007484 [Ficus carica]
MLVGPLTVGCDGGWVKEASVGLGCVEEASAWLGGLGEEGRRPVRWGWLGGGGRRPVRWGCGTGVRGLDGALQWWWAVGAEMCWK